MSEFPIHLIGGGWDPGAADAIYGPFLRAAQQVAGNRRPSIACVVLDEGDGSDQFARWQRVLEQVAPCSAAPVPVTEGAQFDVHALGDADGLLVCGGLTPGYAAALAPAADRIRAWLRAGTRPYAGFSAGSSIAAGSAIVGGWQWSGVPVCPEDAAEELVEITLRPGLGLLDFTVDVHCAQWGTLPRLIAAAHLNPDLKGVGIDENTVLSINSGSVVVHGSGRVWRVSTIADAVAVQAFQAGESVHGVV